jgi:hypothetical protein
MPRRLVGKQALSCISAFRASLNASSGVLILVCAYVALALLWLAIWLWTGNDRWIEEFFRLPAALLLVSLATIEFCSSLMVRREFSPEQPMRKAWSLISFSAGFNLVGSLCAQVLSVRSKLNPLAHMAWWSRSEADCIRQFGLFLGGTFRFGALAAGLAWALKVYRRTGLMARLTAIDWSLLSIMGIYLYLEGRGVATAYRTGWRPTAAIIMGWPTDPLLWLLLAEALVLYRSIRQMGTGWIARCWMSFCIGIFLVVLGNITLWAVSWGYLPWQWNAFEWLIWLPAAGAFALAPVYQLEAIHHARSQRG